MNTIEKDGQVVELSSRKQRKTSSRKASGRGGPDASSAEGGDEKSEF